MSPLPALSTSGMAAPACNTVLVSNSAQNNLQLAILPPSGHSVHVLESLTRLPVSHVSREERWFFFLNFIYLFFFFFLILLHWVFVTAHRLPLSAASGGTSLVAMCGLLLAIAPPVVEFGL